MIPSLRVRVRLELDRFDLDVDFDTNRQVTGIFGASGSGKSSLLETIAGLRRNAVGRISFGDSTWLDSDSGTFLRPEGRNIGYVPQDGLLFPHRNVERNLRSGTHRVAQSDAPVAETVASVARLLELDDLLAREVATLSGGERQRVALGRAICSGPTLLLLDEPLASLDLPLRRKLLPFLRRTRDTFGIPMIFVSHDPLEVQAICDDLIVLQDGTPVARGAPRDVLTDPQIFPLAEREGYQNMLPCQTIDSGVGTCRVRLGEPSSEDAAAGPELVTLTGQERPGEVRLVGIPAHEIMIATHEPVGLTARNVLPARVVEVRAVGSLALVIVDLGPGGEAQLPHLTVEVTETASTDLGLSPGKDVYVVIKATSCRLYG